MARRFKFRPPPGVIVGALLIWSPGVWLAREVEVAREESREVAVLAKQTRELYERQERWNRTRVRGPFDDVDYSPPAGPGVHFLWHGEVVSDLDSQGQGSQSFNHPAQRMRAFVLVLLALGLVGMLLLAVGGLVGGAGAAEG